MHDQNELIKKYIKKSLFTKAGPEYPTLGSDGRRETSFERLIRISQNPNTEEYKALVKALENIE
jgi:preprotein translocase subunit Sss1